MPILPPDAARGFVRRVIWRTFRNYLDTVERHPVAYRRVDLAIRRRLDVPKPDLNTLARAIEEAAPSTHRAAVTDALNALTAAHDAEIDVSQEAAFAIGLAVSQILSRERRAS